MSKLESIRTMLQKILAQFARISTDKALIEYDGDGELEVGMEVHGIDEEGNIFNLEDGEYATDNGIVYVVKDNKVDQIIEKPTEETTGDDVEPENVEEEEVKAEDNPAEEPETNDEPESEPEEDKDEKIKNLEAEVARLEEENGALKERIAELEAKSAQEPAAEAFEKVNKVEKTGNRKLDRLTSILNA